MLFDSTIVIDYLNGVTAAREAIRAEPVARISLVTWIEVMAGARDSAGEEWTRRTLGRFVTLPITTAVAEEAVVLRRTRRLKLPDALIFATARNHGIILVTRNTRDFPEDDPGIRVPYRL